MRVIKALLVFGVGALVAGCASTPQTAPVVEDKPPQEVVAAKAAAVLEARGFAAIGEASSLTLPAAQDRALRRARAALADMVASRVQDLQADYLESTSVADPEQVQAWFAGVERYVRDLILGGARPTMEEFRMDEGLATVWILLQEDPGIIVQALEIRGTANRQLFELVRGSRGYRALLAEAEQYAAFRR